MNRFVVALICVSLTAACSQMPPKKDGELPVPADYKSWPRFLSDIDRPDAKQVREIYVNPAGARASRGRPFPDGTVFVMENYAARQLPDGTLERGPDGKLVKAQLLRIFIMGKGKGWGESVSQPLRNGDWIYAAYLPDGKPAADPISACRACHLPLAAKDYVHRYDEYFQKRANTPAAKAATGSGY